MDAAEAERLITNTVRQHSSNMQKMLARMVREVAETTHRLDHRINALEAQLKTLELKIERRHLEGGGGCCP